MLYITFAHHLERWLNPVSSTETRFKLTVLIRWSALKVSTTFDAIKGRCTGLSVRSVARAKTRAREQPNIALVIDAGGARELHSARCAARL